MNTLNWIAHADWSVHPTKRWLCIATISPTEITIDAPSLVGDMASPDQLIATLINRHGHHTRGVLGLDVCLGVPVAYAHAAGIDSFVELLHLLGQPPWHRWYDVAETVEEIFLHRPFYPLKGGRKKMDDLVHALELPNRDALRRHCDYDPLTGKRWGAPLFWTMGAAQVGKASLHAWKHIVEPTLSSPSINACLWPHQYEQCHTAQVIITEAFPTAYYHPLNLQPGSKRQSTSYIQHIPSLKVWSNTFPLPIRFAPRIFESWQAAQMGEDAFDSLIGCLGMLDAWLQQRLIVHRNPIIRRVEGGIWGLPVRENSPK